MQIVQSAYQFKLGLNIIYIGTKTVVFFPGCKHVYFCRKVGHFNMGVNGGWLCFEVSLKWTLEELQFLALLQWLHFCRLAQTTTVLLVSNRGCTFCKRSRGWTLDPLSPSKNVFTTSSRIRAWCVQVLFPDGWGSWKSTRKQIVCCFIISI